ncbi:MAG TPA: FGGY family carbohydrate kinase [Gammaproteobacteria bacterium]|jgi:glycerol kinase
MTRAVLALDQGGHASRAMVADQRGNILAQAERRIATQRSGTDKVEHSATALLRSLQQAAEAAIGTLPSSVEIAAAGLATQRSSIACWDRASAKPLSPVLSWQDRRAARRVRSLAKEAPWVEDLTGLKLSPHYGATKLDWCLRHLPEVRRARRDGTLVAGPLASFAVAGLLEGQPCFADPVNGARTQLMDIRRGGWSERLCDLFGVPQQILPSCVPNRHDFGHLSVAGRRIPFTVLIGDQPAALFASGEPEPDVAYMNLGTGAFVQCLSSRRAPGLLQSILWRDAERTLYALEGTVNGAGSALEALAKRHGITSGKLMQASQRRDADAARPLFLNGIGGLGAPYWRPAFRSRFIGRGDAGQQAAAVIESILFLLLENLERMQGTVPGLRRIRISGGLAQLDGLCQKLADLSGLPVERPRLHEATALGLARLLGADGMPAADAARFESHPANPLMARRRRWQAAMQEALRDPKKKRPG